MEKLTSTAKKKKNNGMNKPNVHKYFNTPDEIKTKEDLQDLIDNLTIKENLQIAFIKSKEITILTNNILQDLKKLDEGKEIDKIELGRKIAELRGLKYQFNRAKFGKFEEILTGKVKYFN